MVERRSFQLLLATSLVALWACGQAGPIGDAAQGSAAAARSSAPLASSPSAPVSADKPSPPASQSALPAPPPVASAKASASAAPAEPPVIEVRTSATRKKVSVYASGKVTVERSFDTEPDEVGSGQVVAAKVEEAHALLRKEGFCALAPKKRESSPGYIVVETRFTDVACLIELPDSRWNKDPKPKKVMDALRKLEADACPTGCKP